MATDVPLRAAWLVSVLLLSGCAASVAPTPADSFFASGPSALSLAVASNDFGVGRPRVPFILFRGAERIADAQAVSVTAFDLTSGTPVPGWAGAAVGYNDYAVPYWVVEPELSHPGYWGLQAVVTFADGSQHQGQFVIQAVAQVSAPAIGDVPPASRNGTRATEPDLAQLTSDPKPEPGLYQLTVAEALQSSRPTVVTFATPGFCESRLCAPVVDSVKVVYDALHAQANFIHIEVYQSFNPLTYADEMEEWRLPSEPWTFVLDASGKVAARFGGPVSPAELSLALQPLVQR